MTVFRLFDVDQYSELTALKLLQNEESLNDDISVTCLIELESYDDDTSLLSRKTKI